MAYNRRRYSTSIAAAHSRYSTGRPNLDTVEVIRYHADSSAELANHFPSIANDTYGWTNPAQGHEELRTGRTDLGDKANAYLDEFNNEINVPAREWQHTVAGFFPDVPAYLANEPENMWRLQDEPSDRTPIRIYVGVTSSAGVSEDQLIKRGSALAAFALALSSRRTVYITPYVNLGSDSMGSGTSSALISWDLSTSPLVLAEVGACLASPAVMRGFGIAACNILNPRVTGGWMAGYDNEEYMRSVLGASPDDVYIPSILSYDPLLKKPIEWIKANLAHLLDDDTADELDDADN